MFPPSWKKRGGVPKGGKGVITHPRVRVGNRGKGAGINFTLHGKEKGIAISPSKSEGRLQRYILSGKGVASPGNRETLRWDCPGMKRGGGLLFLGGKKNRYRVGKEGLGEGKKKA